MEIAGIAIDETVDITDKVCPLTFVKAKVALEELDDGEVIAIRMNDGEPGGGAGTERTAQRQGRGTSDFKTGGQ